MKFDKAVTVVRTHAFVSNQVDHCNGAFDVRQTRIRPIQSVVDEAVNVVTRRIKRPSEPAPLATGSVKKCSVDCVRWCTSICIDLETGPQ